MIEENKKMLRDECTIRLQFEITPTVNIRILSDFLDALKPFMCDAEEYNLAMTMNDLEELAKKFALDELDFFEVRYILPYMKSNDGVYEWVRFNDGREELMPVEEAYDLAEGKDDIILATLYDIDQLLGVDYVPFEIEDVD